MQYYEVDYFASNQEVLTVLGDQGFREVLGDTLLMIPKNILDDVLGNCVFLMLDEKQDMPPAFFIPKKLVKGKSICTFYGRFYKEDRDKQIEIILHEIAHYILRHEDKALSEEEYEQQEKAAHELKDKWIDEWWKKRKEVE